MARLYLLFGAIEFETSKEESSLSVSVLSSLMRVIRHLEFGFGPRAFACRSKKVRRKRIALGILGKD